MSKVQPMKPDQFETEIAANKSTLVQFRAEWCAPCRHLSPMLEQIAETHVDKLNVKSLDVDTAPDIAALLNITQVPTLILFRNGQEIARRTGLSPMTALTDWLTSHNQAA